MVGKDAVTKSYDVTCSVADLAEVNHQSVGPSKKPSTNTNKHAAVVERLLTDSGA